MSKRPNPTTRSALNLEHLRKQAKALLRDAKKGDPAATARLAAEKPKLSDAQHVIAKENGFASWSKLKAHFDEKREQVTAATYPFRPLPKAANDGNIQEVKQILSSGNVSQHDLDLALSRACVRDLSIAQLLIDYGADPNGEYGDNYGPIILVPCETRDPDGLQFLIEHGANVNVANRPTKYEATNSPMRMAIGTYYRSHLDRKHRCIDLLIAAGAQYDDDAVMDIHRGRIDSLRATLDADPSLINQWFNLDYGSALTLRGVTLLHIAAEFNERAAVDLLLERGADLNARASIGPDNLGGQTPIFHVIASTQGACFALFEHLLSKGPDLSVRANIQENPVIYGKPLGAVLSFTPLGYALRYEHEPKWREASREVVALRAAGAPE